MPHTESQQVLILYFTSVVFQQRQCFINGWRVGIGLQGDNVSSLYQREEIVKIETADTMHLKTILSLRVRPFANFSFLCALSQQRLLMA